MAAPQIGALPWFPFRHAGLSFDGSITGALFSEAETHLQDLANGFLDHEPDSCDVEPHTEGKRNYRNLLSSEPAAHYSGLHKVVQV